MKRWLFIFVKVMNPDLNRNFAMYNVPFSACQANSVPHGTVSC